MVLELNIITVHVRILISLFFKHGKKYKYWVSSREHQVLSHELRVSSWDISRWDRELPVQTTFTKLISEQNCTSLSLCKGTNLTNNLWDYLTQSTRCILTGVFKCTYKSMLSLRTITCNRFIPLSMHGCPWCYGWTCLLSIMIHP